MFDIYKDNYSGLLKEIECLDEQLSLISPFHCKKDQHILLFYALINYYDQLKNSLQYYIDLDPDTYESLYGTNNFTF